MITLAGPVPSAPFAQAIEAAFDGLLGTKQTHRYQVDVRQVDETVIAQANRAFRGLDAPTDVLSFPVFHNVAELPPHDAVIGDLIICPTMTGGDHLALEECYIHGILHLLGYDHDSDQVTWQHARAHVTLT